MKTLPTIANISPPVETDDMQVFVFAWLAACRQYFGGSVPQAKTIASGTFTADEDKTFWILVDTEGAAASDDLDRIALTNIPDGSFVGLQATNTARTIVIRHAQGGSGQFLMANAANFSLDDTEKFAIFRLSGTSLIEVDRSWGADITAQRTFLGLGSAALLTAGTLAANLPTNTNIFDTQRDYTRQHRFTRTTLADGASISWDLDLNQIAKVTLGGNRALANPTNKRDGGQYELYVFQDGTGGRTLSYGTDYIWPSGVAPVIGTGASDLTILTFSTNGTNLFGTFAGPYPL